MKVIKEKINIDDSVQLIDATGIHTLEKFKTYNVISIDRNYKGDLLIAVDEDDNIHVEKYQYHYYNVKRFTKNIRPLRKAKLKEIWKK